METAVGTLTRDERECILNQEIRQFTKKGYELQHSTGTAAQLIKPKPSAAIGANILLTIITLGFWILIWIAIEILVLMVGGRKSEALYIEVLSDGTIERTTDGWLGSTTQDHSHSVAAPIMETPPPEEKPIKKASLSTLDSLWIYERHIEVRKGFTDKEAARMDIADVSAVDIESYGPGSTTCTVRDGEGSVFAKSKPGLVSKRKAEEVRSLLLDFDS